MTKSAYDEGFAAGTEIVETENPWIDGTKESADWTAGFIAGWHEAEKKLDELVGSDGFELDPDELKDEDEDF